MSTTMKVLLVILVLVLLGAGGFGVWYYLDQRDDSSETTTEDVTEVADDAAEVTADVEEEEEEPKEPVQTFENDYATTLPGFDEETNSITSFDDPDEDVDFGVVTDPDDENIAYFATSKYDQDTEEQFIGVYKYTKDSQEWERLYKGTYGPGDFTFGGFDAQATPEFHVLGFVRGDDGIEKLVILLQHADDSPGPCAEPLLLGRGEVDENVRIMIAMPLENPYALELYTVPEDVVQEKQTAQDACLAS